METKDLVLKTLENAGKPMKSGEVAQVSGVEKGEVDKALKKLVAEGKVNSPQRCYYAPLK